MESEKNGGVVERLLLFQRYKRLSVRRFVEGTSLSPMAVANMRYREQRGCNSQVLEEIGRVYPELSMEWLIRGEGDMIREKRSFADEVDKLISEIKRRHSL